MRLEFPEKKHEKQYYEMIQEFLDIKEKPIPGAVGIKEWENYDNFIWRTKNNAEGKNPKHPGHSTLYFIINDNKNIVWSTQIRHELNDELRFEGGNIGYGIRPSERRKGYASIWLTLALEKCKELWLDKVLLTCNKENIWSVKTIVKNGWIWDSDYESEWIAKERYRIPIK